MNILAIGAHPDDIEIGCGGSLIKYREKGDNVFLMILTDGESGGGREVRRHEQMDSFKILQAKELFWGGYSDTKLLLDQKLICNIENVLHKVKPDFIFVNYFDDTHQDHRNLAKATISATRYIKNVLFYEVPTTQNFSPNVFVDINDVLNDKIALLKAHGSQVMKTNIEDLSILEIAKSSANFRGIQGRVKYAEGFVSLRLFINV
ncbi:MAG: PIG-L family deacetylase [Desulfobacteria bacterium]